MDQKAIEADEETVTLTRSQIDAMLLAAYPFSDKTERAKMLSDVAALATRAGHEHKDRVKALEWTKDDCENYHAETEFGDEYIQLWHHGNDGPLFYEYDGIEYKTADEAKAAAQADYERRILSALEPMPEAEPVATLQSRVQPWMMACFGPEISADKLERSDRFMEEAIELVQSVDYPRERIYALIEYVYGRDQGEINQEVGGVMITLAAFCLAHGQDMGEAGETELARIWTKVEKIRAKQAAKPTGSALPIAVTSPPDQTAEIKRLREALEAIASCELRLPGDVVSIARAALDDMKGGA